MHLKEFCRELNDLYRISEFKDYCPNGLQVEGTPEVSHVATAVSASLETIEEAVKRGINLLIVHHGMFWNQESYVIEGPKKQKLSLLLKNEISLAAYHLPMDAHPDFGNNWNAAKDLGWTNLEPFGEMNGKYIGVKGTFDEKSIDIFRNGLEKYYSHSALIAQGGKSRVTSGAIISGGAYKAIPEAAKEGVDCFVTGNFDEPAWSLAYEGKINFFAMGHTHTEKIGPKALARFITDNYSLPCQFIDSSNPF